MYHSFRLEVPTQKINLKVVWFLYKRWAVQILISSQYWPIICASSNTWSHLFLRGDVKKFYSQSILYTNCIIFHLSLNLWLSVFRIFFTQIEAFLYDFCWLARFNTKLHEESIVLQKMQVMTRRKDQAKYNPVKLKLRRFVVKSKYM